MAFISVTRLRLRSVRYLPPFLWHTLRSLLQAKRAPGNLSAKTRRAPDGAFWTLSAWESEASMRAYRNSAAHKKAMPKLLEWCDEASVGHWEQASGELPDWREAHRRMVETGRLSKVNHPSERQRAGEMPPPENI
jgi:quinol monooxygenase YgiN